MFEKCTNARQGALWLKLDFYCCVSHSTKDPKSPLNSTLHRKGAISLLATVPATREGPAP